MINLSNKAAKRFRVKWSSLEERSGDFWKVDVQMMDRVPMLFIVHEYTLFTLVRRKTQFRNPLEIAGEIKMACPWYRYVGEPTIGKDGNRKLTGSISEMKRMTWGLYSPEQMNALEMFINDCIFTYLSPDKNGYGRPFQAVESYAKGETPWL
jgi:hypothetical protein